MADPPYNIGKNFGNNRDLLEIDEYLKWSLDWIQQCLKLLTPNGIFYMYGYPEILARVAAQFPYDKQRILAWHYTNKNMPSCNFWQRSYESILCLWNNKKPEINIDQIREPYTSNFLKCDGKKRIGTLGRFGNSETLYRVNEKGALPRDIIKVPALAGGAGFKERFFLCKTCDCKIFSSKELKNHQKPHQTIIHPTQKPQMLTIKLIDSVIMKNQKGNVLIPFAGSGSECLVAKKKNLNYIGIEINPDYVMLIKELLKNV
ncbi:site-specific DNA-methyltransferase ['Santalum album' aster yellows phytoplasma]|uniref:Methyltransferase n=1 Tax='Santalum album' aster yellows phytoplasma TaxID=2831467 RepID=A0ABS5LLE6_9MOLU|nr:site-specific DNA-methyltransferase ['Santalum album' aster yellows phytoplasma]